jgi:hypothetical protein
LLELSASPDSGPVQWSSDGGKILVAEEQRLVVRLPYSSDSTTITAASACSGVEEGEVSVTVTLVAPRWGIGRG